MHRPVSYVCACVMALAIGRPAIAATDIVLYATDAANLHGNWSFGSDPSAAQGQLLTSRDNAWATPATALAAPADYFEFAFNAPANVPHHVWLRLRAGANSKYNDSVYVQFSDAIGAGGAAIYRIGTASALNVNGESCSGCALSGWGWLDGAYWLAQASTVTFAASGWHTLRVQTREDGVQFDQIVLGASAYVSAAPGRVLDDSTIVAKPAAPGTAPFFGAPAAIPGTIRAQDFDAGVEGAAYHDTTAGNAGGAYRSTGVDLEPSTDGGNDVGWISAGEWLNYTVSVGAAGAYSVTFRVASSGQGGTFHLEMNGANVTGSMTIPNTGAWQNWQSVTRTVTLGLGTQVARLVMDTAGPGGAVGNINSMQFTAAAAGARATPYSGSAAAIPGTIQAENFDNGGEGVAYHDTTTGNSGGAYRSTDVDLEPASAGGYDVGWITAGEWLNYGVTVASAGTYTVNFRAAALGAGGTFHLEMNGANVTGTVSLPNTGGWQNWQNVSRTVTLAAGPQMARLVMDTTGANAVGNFDSIQFTSGAVVTGTTVTVPAGGNLQLAIDAAQAGDTILLLPGVVYSGSFVLPAKSGSSYITIRSAASDAALPGEGMRIGPQYAAQLPKVQGGFGGAAAFITAPGAHHYRLMFLEVVNSYPHNNIIELGDGSANQTALSMVAHDLVIDRCYIHGDPTNGQKRGIALNSASTTIINSYISNIKSRQDEAQTICGWNGPGPYTIGNNYLEAAGETIMFGGSDPAVAYLVPSDIAIVGNHIMKQPGWRGQGWIVKNLIELKNAQRVVIDRNVIEYNWADAQTGWAIMLTPRNQYGGAPWSVVQHVQITNNIVRHVAAGINILGRDDNYVTTTLTNDIVVRNNLFVDVNHAAWGGTGWLAVFQGGAANVVFDRNTAFLDGTSVVLASGPVVTGFVFTNNIVPDNSWAIMGSGASPGNGAFAMYFPGAVFRDNVMIGSNPALYPPGNYFPPNVASVGFTDVASGNYRLAPSSPYIAGATDGTAVGVAMDSLIVQ